MPFGVPGTVEAHITQWQDARAGTLPHEPTVFVVDDDPGVRNSVRELLGAAGYSVKTYASAAEFLKDYDASNPGCLLLDVRMPGMSGLQLQDELRARSSSLPIVLITGDADAPASAQAISGGAFDVVEKPFKRGVLVDQVREAIAKDTAARK